MENNTMDTIMTTTTMPTVPTRIVAPPVTKKFRSSTGGNRVKWYLCDDGVEYTLAELAAAVSISRQTIYGRITSYGWDSPYILVPPTTLGFLINGDRVNASGSDCGGNDEYRRLSDVPRQHNLARLPPPGLWERGGLQL